MNLTTATMSILFAGCMFCTLPNSSAASSQSNEKALAYTTISGQVFVVTPGLEKIELALVTVAAIPEKEMLEHIKKKYDIDIEQQNILRPMLEAAKQEAEAAWEALDKAHDAYARKQASKDSPDGVTTPEEGQYDTANEIWTKKASTYQTINKQIKFLNSPEFYMQDMPTPSGVTKTDADGKFILTVPSGMYVIAATTKRDAPKGAEQYYWLVRINASTPVQSLMLSNENRVETQCRDCVLLR